MMIDLRENNAVQYQNEMIDELQNLFQHILFDQEHPVCLKPDSEMKELYKHLCN